ncbi:MAG: hypothetical protein ACFFG0_45545 [Candidatus Thorarchaeota archaeon]
MVKEKKKFRKIVKTTNDYDNAVAIVIVFGTMGLGYFFIAMFSILHIYNGAIAPYFIAMLSPIIIGFVFCLLYYYNKVEVYYEEI